MEVLTRIIQFKLSLPQINGHGLDIVVVVNIIYLAIWINGRTRGFNNLHKFLTHSMYHSWFQGTHNMFGFYTAFVVNVIKCRSKYKKYSKRIPTSKTGKMRKMPGQGQHWQQRLLGFHPKPLDSPSFCVFLHLNQNIDSLYFEAYRFLKVLWRKIFV